MLFIDSINTVNTSIFTISGFLLASLCFNIRYSTNIDYAYPGLLKSSSYFSFFFFFTFLVLFGFDFNISDNFYFYGQNFQIIFSVTFLIALIAYQSFKKSRNMNKFEYDFLFVCVVLSSICLCFVDDFIIFYICIEFQSLAFYVLATFNRNSEFSTEAGLKYFVFGAIFSCFLLFGFSLIFLSYGATSFETLFSLIVTNNNSFLFFGVLFVIITLFFKIGAAPFHF